MTQPPKHPMKIFYCGKIHLVFTVLTSCKSLILWLSFLQTTRIQSVGTPPWWLLCPSDLPRTFNLETSPLQCPGLRCVSLPHIWIRLFSKEPWFPRAEWSPVCTPGGLPWLSQGAEPGNACPHSRQDPTAVPGPPPCPSPCRSVFPWNRWLKHCWEGLAARGLRRRALPLRA